MEELSEAFLTLYMRHLHKPPEKEIPAHVSESILPLLPSQVQETNLVSHGF